MFLPFLLFVAGTFVACEEVEEAGKYDNEQGNRMIFLATHYLLYGLTEREEVEVTDLMYNIEVWS